MSKHTILQGKDVLVNLPTGYGKTFVYQLLPIAVTEILRSFFLLGDRPVLFKKRAKRFDLCLRLLARASLVPDPVRRPPFYSPLGGRRKEGSGMRLRRLELVRDPACLPVCFEESLCSASYLCITGACAQ